MFIEKVAFFFRSSGAVCARILNVLCEDIILLDSNLHHIRKFRYQLHSFFPRKAAINASGSSSKSSAIFTFPFHCPPRRGFLSPGFKGMDLAIGMSLLSNLFSFPMTFVFIELYNINLRNTTHLESVNSNQLTASIFPRADHPITTQLQQHQQERDRKGSDFGGFSCQLR